MRLYEATFVNKDFINGRSSLPYGLSMQLFELMCIGRQGLALSFVGNYSIKIKILFGKVLKDCFGSVRELTSDSALQVSRMNSSEAFPGDGSGCHCACLE